VLGRFHVALGVYALHLDLLRDLSGLSPSEPHLQIGSSTIAPTDFRAFLAREISKRPPDWPVYIEADPNLEYESVARTIDAVSGFGTQVILLTPRVKADLGEPARQ
jgi:hypothetical protein